VSRQQFQLTDENTKLFSNGIPKIEAKVAPVDNGSGPIDSSRYYSHEFMDKENELLWPKVWNYVGRASDVSEPGDYITADVGKEKILVVCGDDGQIRAFCNVCLHRANQIAVNAMGHSPEGFSCTYHGWTYGLDGKLSQITQSELFPKELLRDLSGLPPVRCEVWGGFVFVTLDENTPPLETFLDVLPEQLASYQMDKMVVVSDLETYWPINWKTALDNFSEGWHSHWVHPQVHEAFDTFHQFDLFDNGMSRFITPFFSILASDETEERKINILKAIMELDLGISRETEFASIDEMIDKILSIKLERQETVGVRSEEIAIGQLAYTLFPNVILSMHPDVAFVIQVKPHKTDPDWCILSVVLLAHTSSDLDYVPPEYIGAPPDADFTGNTRPDRVYIEWGEPGLGGVLEQDTHVVPYVQQAMKTRAGQSLNLGIQEQRIRHYQVEIDRYMRSEKW